MKLSGRWKPQLSINTWLRIGVGVALVLAFLTHEAEWAQSRFIQQLDQPEAARLLGMHRTTLIYQEYCVRKLLTRFVLRKGNIR